MSDKFDELAKGLARSTTRRQALKKFGVGLAGMALACFGLANKARAYGGKVLCCYYVGGLAPVCARPSQGCAPYYPGCVSCTLISSTLAKSCGDCPGPSPY